MIFRTAQEALDCLNTQLDVVREVGALPKPLCESAMARLSVARHLANEAVRVLNEAAAAVEADAVIKKAKEQS